MKKKKINNKDINYGDKDLLDETIENRDIKVKVNCYMDGDVVLKLREEAKKKKIGYTTLLNQKLREIYFEDSIEKRLRKLEEMIYKKMPGAQKAL